MSGEDIAAYWAEARQGIEEHLMPLAKQTKCIPAGATLESLRSRVRRFERDDPKREAALQLVLLAEVCAKGDSLAGLRAGVQSILQKYPESKHGEVLATVDEAVVPGHEQLVQLHERVSVQLSGYLAALASANSFRVKRGAKVRRTQGDATRERVKAASSEYRHLPRDTASVHISEAVGKSPGTIRRLLSELFPGEQWHKSIDLSQQIK